MLALTTYLGPRNLLIDLAFLGLSTMTREWPPLPRAGTPPAPALGRGLLGERDVDPVVARWRGAGFVGLPFPLVVVAADFLATVSSYLSSSDSTVSVDPSRPTRTRCPGAIEVALGRNPGTIKFGPPMIRPRVLSQ